MSHPCVQENIKWFLIVTKRWDGLSEQFIAASCSFLEEESRLLEIKTEALRAYQPTGTWAAHANDAKMKDIDNIHSKIIVNHRILSAVRALTYHFVTLIINQKQFSLASRDIFFGYQSTIEARLAETAADAFAKMPECFEKLQAGSTEAISHALTSCRRDSIFPAQNDPVLVDGEALDCGANRPKNRIIAYLGSTNASKSRRARLKRALFDLYDRVSTGVHADVEIGEARALVLQTYTLLGEIALL